MRLPRSLQSPLLFASILLLSLGVPVSLAVLGTPHCRSGDIYWSEGFSHADSPRAGETFPLSARFRNGLGTDVHLLWIEFGAEILRGIEITGSTPAWTRSSILPDGSLRAEFDQPLADESQLAVQFDARAVRPGNFTGEIRTRFDDAPRSGAVVARFDVEP